MQSNGTRKLRNLKSDLFSLPIKRKLYQYFTSKLLEVFQFLKFGPENEKIKFPNLSL